MKATVRLTVIKGKKYVKTPHFVTNRSTDDPQGYYCTTGVGTGNVFPLSRIAMRRKLIHRSRADIREAARDAVRHMIAMLVEEHGLDRVNAYMLCSIAGDLRMHEVVCSFSALLPLSYRSQASWLTH